MSDDPRFSLGDLVCKTRGSQWHGRVVGTYSTELTPEGYCVESAYEAGSVQIYPVGALELWSVADDIVDLLDKLDGDLVNACVRLGRDE